METEHRIETYFLSLDETKRADLQLIHETILSLNSAVKLWFLDGKNADGKIVSNPNIGYGTHLISYKNGTTKEFYKIGISANSTGISVYIFGIEDKNFLKETFGSKLGKAKITSYCIQFKKIEAIDFGVLKGIILFGLKN